jgi:hypothetical protein
MVRHGAATLDDMKNGIEELIRHPAFPDIDTLVMDLTDAQIVIDANEMKTYSRFVDESVYKDRNIRLAVIAPKDVNFGMSNMYSMLSENSEHIRVCRNREEALEWLQLDGGNLT